MIRQAAERDAAGVLAIYEPIVRDTPISFEMEPPTEEEMAARIARSHEWLVIERDRYIIGYAYAAPFHGRAAYRWSVEISIYLAQDARGSGLGRKLLSELLDSLSQRGFVNAFAGNSPSEPRQRPALRIVRIREGRSTAQRWVQARCLARCRLVAAPAKSSD